ncbi:MAG: NUDIX domain-containing protein [Pigmentiphaga sp.]|uniref:GDP-mannose mannosyl hydrolase n=1 Tax=Pigmentiphaga sp. TaxID=1977564 RepID=UPI0029B1BDAF|nr:NUDIX domain-containing protein [Pigmentiphaga sp.]MDX3905542.1 NUDIX domain-containing protein [Pigmentiphaga sp.]
MRTEDPALPPTGLLSADDFRKAVAMVPLVSIDLLLRNSWGAYLLGLRVNPPARDTWFVPGGRIRKNESLAHARTRIAREELGLELPASAWVSRGVYEHFYQTNFADESGQATHYVVLAFEAQLGTAPPDFPRDQHRRYCWMPAASAGSHPSVHPYTQAYFKERVS